MLGLWTPRRLGSGRRDAWTPDPWSQKILSVFSNIYFFLIINVEFLIISSTLMHYGSGVANDCSNSNLLPLIL